MILLSTHAFGTQHARNLAAVVLILCAGGVGADAPERVSIPEIETARPLLRYERPSYRNFALTYYTNPPDHSVPYRDRQNAIYNLTRGLSPDRISSVRLDRTAHTEPRSSAAAS